MSEEFSKRMAAMLSGQNVADYFKAKSSRIEDTTFAHDPNYKRGMIYDWNMEEIEEIDFKFQKVREHAPEKKASDYWVQFRPGVCPELLYKDLYYKADGKERLGFYLDVPDFERGVTDKWLLVGKEPKVNFNRYYAFKCNWCLEWVVNGKYYNTVGVWRDSQDNNINSPDYQKLGGSELDGDGSFMLPSNPITRTLLTGVRVMITDSDVLPAVYEIQAIKDTEPLGVMKIYLKRRLINHHTDLWGDLNSMEHEAFAIDMPVPDLPEEYGQKFHYLCDCKKSAFELDPVKVQEPKKMVLEVSDAQLRVNGSPVRFKVRGGKEDTPVQFEIYIDNVKYEAEDLTEYFEFTVEERMISVKAINPIMQGYILKISVVSDQLVYLAEEVEVVL